MLEKNFLNIFNIMEHSYILTNSISIKKIKCLAIDQENDKFIRFITNLMGRGVGGLNKIGRLFWVA